MADAETAGMGHGETNKLVLVVDDDPNVLEVLDCTLKGEGIKTCKAATIEDVIKLLSEKTFDLAILDIRLPDGSTLELVREIKSLDPKLPIIIMTASHDDDNIAEFLSAGVNAYLTKPIDVENLFNLVDQFIG